MPQLQFPSDERLRYIFEGRLDSLVHLTLPSESVQAALSGFKAMSGGYVQSTKSDSEISFYPAVADYKNDARPTAVALREGMAITLGIAKDEGHAYPRAFLKALKRWRKRFGVDDCWIDV